ncbi:MAG: damage-inducible protein D [Chitinophagales bacterium]|nr:damage-inducible protein D [Chitinophagales bacterium]
MKKELILELFEKFEAACYRIEDTDCWSARDLQTILGYAEWRNFLNAIEKAKNACESAGEMLAHHFVDVNKMVDIGSGTQRRIEDIALTRYACYLIAQNGDPTQKPEIAFAQTYFAVQTRRAMPVETKH